MRRLALVVAFMFPLTLLAGKNLAEYPLQIQVIESHWNRPINGVDRRYGGVEGWGRGDIRDGDSIHGFDFAYTAAEPFHRTVGDGRYLAKWKKKVQRWNCWWAKSEPRINSTPMISRRR